MTRPFQTVRTDRHVFETGEEIPFWLRPKHCSLHRVSWWSNEISIDDLMGKKNSCPICLDNMPMELLLFIESRPRPLLFLKDIV